MEKDMKGEDKTNLKEQYYTRSRLDVFQLLFCLVYPVVLATLGFYSQGKERARQYTYFYLTHGTYIFQIMDPSESNQDSLGDLAQCYKALFTTSTKKKDIFCIAANLLNSHDYIKILKKSRNQYKY